jgi:hypothetical protein
MGDPHNPDRYGERWNPVRWAVLAAEIDAVKGYGALSGGWAWHFMSPPHDEEKHLHDHRDIDLHAFPDRFTELIVFLKERGYHRQTTRFDDPSGEFVRFEKHVEACRTCGSQEIIKSSEDDSSLEEWLCFKCGAGSPGGGPSWEPETVKVIFDLFVQDVPTIEVEGYSVVEPGHMLTFYGVKHSSEQCVAVQAARRILAAGGEIVKNPLLVGDYGI